MGAQHGKPTPTGLLRPPAISYDRGTKSERSTELDEGLARSQRALPFTLEREATMTAEEVEEFMFRYRAGIEQPRQLPFSQGTGVFFSQCSGVETCKRQCVEHRVGHLLGRLWVADGRYRGVKVPASFPGAVHGICTSGKKQAAHPAKAGSAPTSIKPHQ
ncbi:hypothetical protein T492DRAFT_1139259 [Pavlovales sp. CCMP2436]|nr:hypothetical protein T492DRAFT_1139259 [Pavlovales sp. CCMP2436]